MLDEIIATYASKLPVNRNFRNLKSDLNPLMLGQGDLSPCYASYSKGCFGIGTLVCSNIRVQSQGPGGEDLWQKYTGARMPGPYQ